MQILSVRPEPPGSGSAVARFDVALSDNLRIFNLRLGRRSGGGFSVYSPNAYGERVVTFGPDLVDQIAAAVSTAMELSPHDRIA